MKVERLPLIGIRMIYFELVSFLEKLRIHWVLVVLDFDLMLEFAWIIERLREKKFHIAQQMADSLIAAWRTGESAMTVYGEMRKSSTYLQQENIEEWTIEELDDPFY